MKLEELSKEELIYIIQRKFYLDFSDIEFDVLSYRADKCLQKESQYREKANELLDEYIRLLCPFDGKPLSDIPIDILKKANEAMKQRCNLLKKENRKESEYKKIQNRMDEVLELLN